MRFKRARLVLIASFLAIASAAPASTSWYVNGISGSDSNNCTSAQTACKTIGHAISLASSGDSINVAAATYNENLTIGASLNILGSNTNTTISHANALTANLRSTPILPSSSTFRPSAHDARRSNVCR